MVNASAHFTARPARTLALSLLLLAAATVCLAQTGPQYKALISPDFRHLLVLHSYGQGSAAVEGVQHGIEFVVDKSEFDILLRVEHMDADHVSTPSYIALLTDLFRHKYSNAQFDGIITSGNPALNLAAELKAELFPDTVIIAAGVDVSAELPFNLDGIHIIEDRQPHGQTLALAIERHPEARRLVVVNRPPAGTSDMSASLTAELRGLSDRLEVDLLEHMPPGDLEAALAQMGDDTIAYLAEYVRTDSTGLDLSLEDVRRMAYVSSAPIYISREHFLGTGVLGGKLIAWDEQGKRATWMTLNLWRGRHIRKHVDDLQVANRTAFDHNTLTRFGLAPTPPNDARIVNDPETTLDKARRYLDIHNVGAAFAFLILVMALINWRRTSAIRRRIARSTEE